MTNNKALDTAFQALSDLTKSRGYLYVLLYIIEEDINVPVSEMEEVNPYARVSLKEATMLLGLTLKCNQNFFDEPKDTRTLSELRKETYRLLDELHWAMSEPLSQKVREAVGRMEKSEEPMFPTKEILGDAQCQRETFFYSNEPAYDLEYLKFAPEKYKYDKEWLIEHKDFDIEKVCQAALYVRDEINNRMMRIPFFPKEKLEESFKDDPQYKDDPVAIESALDMFSLLKYEDFLSSDTESNKDKCYIDIVDCHDLCQLLLKLFSFDIEDNEQFSPILKNFSIKLGEELNLEYTEPLASNIVNRKPIIKINDSRFILPLTYLLYQSIYESPYYWFGEDRKYAKRAMQHLGDAGEDLVYHLLKPVFNNYGIYQNVIIRDGKKDITDIDVLCVLGSKALCIQVKSKKLTENAKRGDDESYRKDFKGAITDAYQQGITCKESILSHKYALVTKDGVNLNLESVDDVYILCVTTGFYTAITHLVDLRLNIEDNAPVPVVFNVFDLHILSHYLKNPYEFLYYIRQRIATNGYSVAENESVLLSYHLSDKLWKDKTYNRNLLGSDIAGCIDSDYKNIFDIKIEGTEERAPFTCCWISDEFRMLLLEIQGFVHPEITDIVFDMCDCSPESDRILSMIRQTRERSIRNHSIVSMCILFEKGELGITYTASYTNDKEELLDQLQTYAQFHKYKHKGNKWVGLAGSTLHPNMVDLLIYDKKPWTQNDDIEHNIKLLESINNPISVEIPGKKKIGRNEPCPCGSGLKYKKMSREELINNYLYHGQNSNNIFH